MAVPTITPSRWRWRLGSILKNMAAPICKWTNDDTARLIEWRARNAGIFSGRRLTAIRGYELFVKENGLEGLVSPAFIKKKWENLKQKYVTLKRLSMESGSGGAPESWRWYSQMEDALGGRILGIKSCDLRMPAVYTSTDQDMVHALELTADSHSPPTLPPVKRQRTDSDNIMLEYLTKQEERDQQRDIEWLQREELREREALEREEQRESEAVEREERREREAIARESRREREAIEREARREQDAREREETREQEFRDREERREREFQERYDRLETVFREREEQLLSILGKLLNK